MGPRLSARKDKKPADNQEKTTREKEEAKNRKVLEKEAASKAKAKAKNTRKEKSERTSINILLQRVSDKVVIKMGTTITTADLKEILEGMAKMLASKEEGTSFQEASARTVSMQSQRLELFLIEHKLEGTGNMMIVMDIQDRIDAMKQGEKSIAEYSTELKRFWFELDYYDPLTITDSASIANTWVERRRVIQLMKGLNSEFETRRAMICHQSPLPRMEEVIAALSQEESRMKVMTSSGNLSVLVCSALLAPITNDRECYICRKTGHISWNCPLSHDNGRGEGNRSSRGTFRGRTRGRGRGRFAGRANLVVAEKSDIGESTKNSELEELRAYKQRMESFNTQGSTYSFLGASKNVTRSSSGFDTYFKYPPSHKETIQTEDGSLQPIEGIGSIKCSPSLALESVLHVPSFSERDTKRTLGTGIRRDGLWFMNKESDGVALTVTTTEEVKATVMLEHFRLDHVPFESPRRLRPELLNKVGSNKVICDAFTSISGFKWTDNDTEYLNKEFASYLSAQGIVHQTTCPDTLAQNGAAERKNCHLLEVARSLIFTTNVPKILWSEAVLTAAYLINRMPSQVLGFKYPCELLMGENVYAIPSKVFGCVCFVRDHRPSVSKLDLRALKCIFVGYSGTQKGYRCWCPSEKRVFVNMDVTFREQEPFYGEKTQPFAQLKDSPVISNISRKEENSLESVGDGMMQDSNEVIVGIIPCPMEEVNVLGGEGEKVLGGGKKKVVDINLKEYSRRQKTGVHGEIGEILQSTPQVEDDTRERELPQSRKHDVPNVSDGPSRSPLALSPGTNGNESTIINESLPIVVHREPRATAGKPPVRYGFEHDISNYVSYTSITPAYKTFIASLQSVSIPRNWQEAKQDPKWLGAMHEELSALEKNKT
ncbi:hypothetical protein AgCh_019173 [Apium graveolens]